MALPCGSAAGLLPSLRDGREDAACRNDQPLIQEIVMTSFRPSLLALAVGLLATAPVFAATAVAAAAADAQKQHTDGGDSPDNPRATDESAAAWHKQHTALEHAPDRVPAVRQ
jgi:hypothetical protein